MNSEGIEIYAGLKKKTTKPQFPKSKASVVRNFYKSVTNRFLPVKIEKRTDSGSIIVGFRRYGNKHLYSDAFGRCKSFQKGDLLRLDKIVESSTYVSSSGLSKQRKDKIVGFHYFKMQLHGNTVFLNVAEERRKSANGMVKVVRFLYSVTDRIK